MKVSKLIELLKEQDKNADVVVYGIAECHKLEDIIYITEYDNGGEIIVLAAVAPK